MDLRILSSALVVTQMGCASSPRVGGYVATSVELRYGCSTPKQDFDPGYPNVVVSNATNFTIWFESYPSLAITAAVCELDGPNFSCERTDTESDELYVGTVRNATSFSLLWTQHITGDFGRKNEADEPVTCSDIRLTELEWESELPDYIIDALARGDG